MTKKLTLLHARKSKTNHEQMQDLRLDLASKNAIIRRGKVLSMLAYSMTGVEIAKALKVHESTISRDIQYLKEQSQQFIYDLAKSDLAFYYQQSLNTIDQIKRELWQSYNNNKTKKGKGKDHDVALLKLIKECEETKYSMYKDGPFLMNIKSLEEKVRRIEIESTAR